MEHGKKKPGNAPESQGGWDGCSVLASCSGVNVTLPTSPKPAAAEPQACWAASSPSPVRRDPATAGGWSDKVFPGHLREDFDFWAMQCLSLALSLLGVPRVS